MEFSYKITFYEDQFEHDPCIGELVDEQVNGVVERTYERKLEVRPATMFMSIQRESELQKAYKRYTEIPEEARPEHAEQVIEIYYIPLSVCSVGQVPNRFEFVHVLDELTVEAWDKIVRAVNPHWYNEEKKMT